MEEPAALDEQEHTPTYPQLPVSKVMTSFRSKANFVLNYCREHPYVIMPFV